MRTEPLIQVLKDHLKPGGKFVAIVGGYEFSGLTELQAARKAAKYALEEVKRLTIEHPEWFIE